MCYSIGTQILLPLGLEVGPGIAHVLSLGTLRWCHITSLSAVAACAVWHLNPVRCYATMSARGFLYVLCSSLYIHQHAAPGESWLGWIRQR